MYFADPEHTTNLDSGSNGLNYKAAAGRVTGSKWARASPYSTPNRIRALWLSGERFKMGK